jgi:hypothetical protein
LRGKGLVVRLKGTQQYQLTSEGGQLAVLYLKLYERLYGPLTAGVLEPVRGDVHLSSHRRAKSDRLYTGVDWALDKLARHFGIASEKMQPQELMENANKN